MQSVIDNLKSALTWNDTRLDGAMARLQRAEREMLEAQRDLALIQKEKDEMKLAIQILEAALHG